MGWHVEFLRNLLGSDAKLTNEIASFAIVSVSFLAPKYFVLYSPPTILLQLQRAIHGRELRGKKFNAEFTYELLSLFATLHYSIFVKCEQVRRTAGHRLYDSLVVA